MGNHRSYSDHLSAPPKDGLIAYRLLRYQVRIWEDWLAKHPKAKALPMIIPIVLYHGLTPWSETRRFDALLEVPAGVRPAVDPYLIQFAYLLNDLSEISDDELRDGAMMTALAKLVAMCFKHARRREDFIKILTRWMDVVREVARAPNGLKSLAQVLCYILEVNDHIQEEDLTKLLEREIGPEAKEAIVTAGQQLIEQGRQQGIEQGRQQGIRQGIEEGRQQGIEQGRQQGIRQGIEEGRQQGIQELLLRLLRQRFGDEVNARVELRVATASVEQIETWTTRVLSAATLAELLTD